MTNDNVNYPSHYTQQPHECIWFTEKLGFCLGNAFKYCWRAQDKNGVEDLKKARWYLSRVIEQQLPLELDYEIWAAGVEKLMECSFSVGQKPILRALWLYAKGGGRRCVYDELACLLVFLDVWIAKKEAESET